MTERPLAADPFTTTNGYTLPRPPAPPRRRERGPVWNVVLFVLTCFTTLLAGTMFSGSPTFDAYRASREPLPWMLSGVPFAATLLGILVVHEFGHYFTARARGAAVSLPFFIPAPPAIFMAGTLGAIIRMRSSVRDRNALFDIAAAGPGSALSPRLTGGLGGLAVAALIPLGVAAAAMLSVARREGTSLIRGVNWLVLAALIRFALGYGHGRVLAPLEPLTPGRRVVGVACLVLLALMLPPVLIRAD